MVVRLFDIQNGVVVPTEHCYTIKDLKYIMDIYPDDYIKRYIYLFYMTCPDSDNNPFFFLEDEVKESQIAHQIQMDFSSEDDGMQEALTLCRKLYETPTSRAYEGIKSALDRIAKYMQTTAITDGKDGNIGQIRAIAKDFDDIRQSYKGTYKDLQDEQKTKARGNTGLAYDG